MPYSQPTDLCPRYICLHTLPLDARLSPDEARDASVLLRHPEDTSRSIVLSQWLEVADGLSAGSQEHAVECAYSCPHHTPHTLHLPMAHLLCAPSVLRDAFFIDLKNSTADSPWPTAADAAQGGCPLSPLWLSWARERATVGTHVMDRFERTFCAADVQHCEAVARVALQLDMPDVLEVCAQALAHVFNCVGPNPPRLRMLFSVRLK